MPTIGIRKTVLDRALKRVFTQERFDELCFEYGLELDEVVEENGEEVYKIELPANRYDLLCVEGLARALLIFQKLEGVPDFVKEPAQATQRLVIKPETKSVRPHCVAAILRSVTLDADAYASFIDLQDKLHQNIGRKRSLVAIGTHDLDTLKGPFVFTAQKPEDIKFCPLNQTSEYTAAEMMQFYSADNHLKAYLPIIRDKPLYPVIYDSNGVVLSMPPIINGEHSKISTSTKNIFIECTATDLNKAKIVLDTLVTMFSQYCAKPFSVESVEVEQIDGSVITYPELPSRTETIKVADVNRAIGIDISAREMAELLTRMCLSSRVQSEHEICVTVPPTRHDILHACDIVEDVAIAHGYNRIDKRLPAFAAAAHQCPLNALADKLRLEMAMAGYTEALTFSLCSEADIATHLRRPELLTSCVKIANPKTSDFQMGRPSLLPGLLRTLRHNQDLPLPLKLFEVQDVLLKDDSFAVGAKNKRHLSAIHCGKSAGVEHVQGLLDRLMQLVDVPPAQTRAGGYWLRANDSDGAFFAGRAADILVGDKIVGCLGALHPEVMTAFELPFVASALEVDIEPFL